MSYQRMRRPKSPLRNSGISEDPYTAEQLQFELYKLFFTQIGIVNSRNITK